MATLENVAYASSFFMKPNLLSLLLCLTLAACDAPTPIPSPLLPPTQAVPTPTASPIPAPTATPTVATIATLLHTPDTGWIELRPGLERRVVSVADAQGAWVESLYILRVEPTLFRFNVAYDPVGQPLAAWSAITGAQIVVNGGYFREEGTRFIPTGLTVINSQPMGVSYEGYGGMFAVTADGPQLRALAQNPYVPGESLQAALQSFPLLVKPGGVLGFPEAYEDNLQARRAVVARDRQGRFLFMVADQGYFTLHQLSLYLTNSDLNLDIALNLDGGPSSGIFLREPREQIPAYGNLPIVITVHAR